MYLGSWVHNNFVSAAIPKDVGVLLALARSPRCRKVLRDTFNVIALKKGNLLNPKSGWELSIQSWKIRIIQKIHRMRR